MKKFNEVNDVWYGNIYTGEIEEVHIFDKHSVRGGNEYVTDRGHFLATDNESEYYCGDDIFCTDKKHLINTMKDFVFGMSEDAKQLFEKNCTE